MYEEVVTIWNSAILDFGIDDVNVAGNAVPKFALSLCMSDRGSLAQIACLVLDIESHLGWKDNCCNTGLIKGGGLLIII